MAIVFFEEKKRQQLLIPIFVVIITIAVAIFWFGVVKEGSRRPPVVVPERKIEINLEVLKKPILSTLELFQEIPELDQEPGRENPFLPYSQ